MEIPLDRERLPELKYKSGHILTAHLFRLSDSKPPGAVMGRWECDWAVQDRNGCHFRWTAPLFPHVYCDYFDHERPHLNPSWILSAGLELFVKKNQSTHGPSVKRLDSETIRLYTSRFQCCSPVGKSQTRFIPSPVLYVP
jgi:hypothetical protein